MPIHAWVLLIAFTALTWTSGVLFRAGYMRYMGKRYLDPFIYTGIYNPMNLIPAACAWTSVFGSALLAKAGSPAKWLFFLLVVAFGVWTLVVSYRPPEFLKPRWLREEEQRQRQGVTSYGYSIDPYLKPSQVICVGRASMLDTLAAAARRIGYDAHVVERSPTGLDLPDAGPRSAIVVATFGRYDEDAVQAALSTGAGYVGLVAPAECGAAFLQMLRESAVAEDQLARVRIPARLAGLDLSHPDNDEIAVAILADIMVFFARVTTRR